MHNRFIIIFIILHFFFSCKNDITEERAIRANKSNEILIAVVDSSTNPSRFTDGIKLAINELNENNVSGKIFKAIYFDDKGSLEKAQKIAWTIAKNPNIIAVVGHFLSKIAIAVSITYEDNGIIFFTPKTTQSDLIRDTNSYTFRNIPADNIFGQEMAKCAQKKQFKKMSIIYERESFGKRLSEIFQKYGDNNGIDFVSVKSYSPWKMDFRELISELLNGSPFEALLICGNMPSSAYLVKQLRDMGINVPIIGSDSLDSMQLLNIAGKCAEGVIVPTVFDPKLASNITRNFVDNFKYIYGFEPDTLAAQGYDAIKVLGHAIEKSGSSIPIVISTNMRFLQNWNGVTGSYSFTQKGDITGKSIYFKSVKKDKFVFIERELNTNQKVMSETLEDIAIRIPVNNICNIDPVKISDHASIEIAEQLFLGLTDLNPETFEPVEELAAKWNSDNDCKSFTFYLRKDVHWTDGSDVTAYDIEKTIKRNLTNKTKSSHANLLYIIKNAKQIDEGKEDISKLGVKALDKYTIEFTLEYQASYFPKIAGLWIFRPLPVKIINKFGDNWTNPENIITNGSYKLHAWEKGMKIILHKNEKYYDYSKVSIPEIHYYVINDPVLGLSLYYNGELDILGGHFLKIPEDNISHIYTNPYLKIHHYRYSVLCTDVFVFNLKKNPVDNVLVRKALSFAANRSLIVNSLNNNSKIANSLVPESILPLNNSYTSKNGFEPLKAKKCLTEAGYQNGLNFPQISIVYENTLNNENISKTFSELLNHYLNIKVKLNPIKINELKNSNYNFQNSEIMHIRLCADYPDPSKWYNLLTCLGINNSKISSILDQTSKTAQFEKRIKLFNEAEKILNDKICALIPINYHKGDILVNPRINGWYHMEFGGQHIRNWSLISND